MHATGLRVAVVGGGINGIMAAWAAAQAGHAVTLFERGQLMGETSSASTKLLHGGLRYLEHGHFGLVREALRERSWWIRFAPDLAHPLGLILPIYADSRRSRAKIKLGLLAYDALAGRLRLGRHRWLVASELAGLAPSLKTQGLRGGYVFFDGQMDDHALGLRAAEAARAQGVEVVEQVSIEAVDTSGRLWVEGEWQAYDRLVNVAGPWAEQLLCRSGVKSDTTLQLVRGSHIFLADEIKHAFLVEVPGEGRICFVLPYKGKTLVGTTEVEHDLTADRRPECSEAEAHYLLNVYNRYFGTRKQLDDIEGSFAGVRPLVRSRSSASDTSREYRIERQGKLITVWGGKWTTSRALAAKLVQQL